MKSHYTCIRWTAVALIALLGVLTVRAESEMETVTKTLKSDGILGLASLIEKDSIQAPRIGSGDSFQPDQTALAFGRDLLRQINVTMEARGTNPDVIVSLLVIGQWLKGEAGYGNLIISHRAFDVAGGLALKTLGLETAPSKQVLDLAKRVAESTMEPSFRARVLDKELGTNLFSEQLAAVGPDDREQAIRKRWKNLCFLGYSEANPAITRDLGQAKESIVESLGEQADAFISLGKTAPKSLLAPQTLQYTSTELLEARNLWFVSMASAPGNLRDIASVLEYLSAAKQLPPTTADASKEVVEKAFASQWATLDIKGNPAIANRVANIAYRIRSGVPLDRDSSISASETQ